MATLKWLSGRRFWPPALWCHSVRCRRRWCAAGIRQNKGDCNGHPSCVTCTCSTFSFYPLPGFRGHDLYLVSRNQLLQHFGDHDKLRPVWINFDPEEQPTQVEHLLFGTGVITLQVLGQLLYRGASLVKYCGKSVTFSRIKSAWLNTWGKWNVRSATRSCPGLTLNQSFLSNITG